MNHPIDISLALVIALSGATASFLIILGILLRVAS